MIYWFDIGYVFVHIVAHCVTAWPNVTCLDNITTY